MELVFANPPPPEALLRAAIRDLHRLDETEADARILAAAELPADSRDRIAATARRLVVAVRRERLGKGGLDAFLQEYALSSPEGVALMCLAEALLRIPDADTVDRLIRDKIAAADWHRHLGLDADRPPAAAGSRRGRSRQHPAPPDRALERAGMASGGDRGDAHSRRPV